MKKFFIEDFNVQTNFIKCKRRKNGLFYVNCVIDYVQSKFSEYSQTQKPGAIGNGDFTFFFGCLLYHEFMLKGVGVMDGDDQMSKKKANMDNLPELRSNFNSFTFVKLKTLVKNEFFSYIFSTYYLWGV
jgi:hypothetical protein